ncbi:Sec-independent protein translocase subunit TatA [Rhodococcus phenolicus]|uniref:Sec-independent protein translocase subunit TatA n=1 Tax=Rhodococcus phenolicus TaxID=263849 RepID=UPI0008373202|nr:Sec-independent protein translocase subunit TatA [Rhodococcus phenolicus]
MGAMSPWHWAIVAIVVVILFGSKKLPDAARGLGRSLRIFKSEVKEMQNDDARPATPQTAPNPLPAGQTVDKTVSEAQHTEPRSA